MNRKQAKQILKDNPGVAAIHKVCMDRDLLLTALEDFVKCLDDPNMPIQELIKRGKAAISAVRDGHARRGK